MTEADVYAMVLGRTIAELRERHGFSQVAFARQVGLTQPTLSRIEKGTAQPDLYTLRTMAKAFALEPPVFLAQVEDAFGRTAQTAQSAGAAPPQADTPWWQVAALSALGVTSVVGLAVAAALAAEKASRPAPEPKPFRGTPRPPGANQT